MTRAALIFLVCFMLPNSAWAQPAAVFDASTAASVWSAALSYIAPRALAPLSIPQMTLWGLNGLAALDPDLSTTRQGNQIQLFGPSNMLLSVTAPAATDAAGWGRTAAAIAAAAYAASPALQQGGTQGVITSFFDELFNHFDPYSRYEPPLQAAQDQLMITGIAGTGVTFARQGSNVVIASIAADSPAENAGLTAGMVVQKIDGTTASPYQTAALTQKMSGIYGTPTTLTVQDPGNPGSFQDITLTRGFIPENTVFPEAAPPGLVALKISAFNKGTSEQFSTALAAAMAQLPIPHGLIIDLRGNRGGILRQAVLVADSLLPSGQIVQAAGRDTDADQSFSAEGADLTGGARIVVLVDGQTASAAEILAAALSDNRRALVVGSETLGKGLVQTLTSLPDGGELFVTWSRVLAPRGWPLQTLGVLPNVCTSLGPTALASQLAALNSGKNLLGPALDHSRAMRAPLQLNDILTIRNNCPAAIGSDEDFSAANALISNPPAYQAALLP